MKPQVNLYAQLPTARPLFLSVKHIAWCLSGLLVVLLCCSLHSKVQLLRDTEKLQLLEQQQQNIAKQVINLEVTIPKQARSENLMRAVHVLQQRLQRRQQIQQHIRSLIGSNMYGFGGYLLDLAQYAVQGVWLRELYIDTGDTNIVLRGGAQDSNAVTEYMQRLSSAHYFKNKRFSMLDIKRASKVANQVDFVVRTQQTPREGRDDK